MTPLSWSWLGRVDYRAAWSLQEATRDRILAGEDLAEHVFFCEHDPVVTLGRSADATHVLAPPDLLAARGIDVVHTNRGGDVTIHGPGQLVVYPVLRLTRGVLAFLGGIGRAIAHELATHGIAAEWRRDPAGVWVGDAKIAACGLHLRRRVAIHGFALNVTTAPLELFKLVVPCGLVTPVTTLADHAPPPPLDVLAAALADRIAFAFDRTATRAENLPGQPLSACDRKSSR